MAKVILGFVLHERVKSAGKVQELLTSYGCEINMRIGLHVTSANSCSPNGLILLEFVDDSEDKAAAFEKDLKAIADVDIQKMIF